MIIEGGQGEIKESALPGDAALTAESRGSA
jgi:hypothetical protein